MTDLERVRDRLAGQGYVETWMAAIIDDHRKEDDAARHELAEFRGREVVWREMEAKYAATLSQLAKLREHLAQEHSSEDSYADLKARLWDATHRADALRVACDTATAQLAELREAASACADWLEAYYTEAPPEFEADVQKVRQLIEEKPWDAADAKWSPT